MSKGCLQCDYRDMVFSVEDNKEMPWCDRKAFTLSQEDDEGKGYPCFFFRLKGSVSTPPKVLVKPALRNLVEVVGQVLEDNPKMKQRKKLFQAMERGKASLVWKDWFQEEKHG